MLFLNMIQKPAEIMKCVFLLTLWASIPVCASDKTICFTMDDLPFNAFGKEETIENVDKWNHQLLYEIEKNNIPVAIFVNENGLETGSKDEKLAIYKKWIQNRLITIGNHTYNHLNAGKAEFSDFQRDVLKGDDILESLCSRYGEDEKYFRFPFNCTGNSMKKRDKLFSFLNDKGYQVVPFTIESADYLFNAVYVNFLEKGDMEKAGWVASEFLKYTEKMTIYMDSLVETELKLKIPHIFLCHGNRLVTDCFSDLVQLFKKQGYRFIPLKQVMDSESGKLKNHYGGKYGISWVYRWMKDEERRKALMRKEPEFNMRIYNLYKKMNK